MKSVIFGLLVMVSCTGNVQESSVDSVKQSDQKAEVFRPKQGIYKFVEHSVEVDRTDFVTQLGNLLHTTGVSGDCYIIIRDKTYEHLGRCNIDRGISVSDEKRIKLHEVPTRYEKSEDNSFNIAVETHYILPATHDTMKRIERSHYVLQEDLDYATRAKLLRYPKYRR